MPKATGAVAGLQVVPVTRDRLEDLAELFRGSEAATCWDMVPRTTAGEERTCVSSWKQSGLSVRAGRQEAFAALMSRERAPGLIASLHGRPGGWTLVAFSGEVQDGGVTYTESGMNGLPETQTAETFKRDEFRILIAADKFQTGFDQPLLHTMYVDKRLAGVTPCIPRCTSMNLGIAVRADRSGRLPTRGDCLGRRSRRAKYRAHPMPVMGPREAPGDLLQPGWRR